MRVKRGRRRRRAAMAAIIPSLHGSISTDTPNVFSDMAYEPLSFCATHSLVGLRSFLPIDGTSGVEWTKHGRNAIDVRVAAGTSNTSQRWVEPEVRIPARLRLFPSRAGL